MRVKAPFVKESRLRVILREDRKRQIREIGELLGLPAVKIIRVCIGPLQIGNLKPREWRYLTAAEVAVLKGQPGKAKSVLEKDSRSRHPRCSSKGSRQTRS